MYKLLLLLPIFLLALPEIDIVIPCHKKDKKSLQYCLESVKKNIANVRSIYVVSKEKLSDEAQWIPESTYSFSIEEVAEKMYGTPDPTLPRVGWMYQQFLKLYAKDAIPDLKEQYLVIDADVILLKPVSFFTEEGVPLYSLGREHHHPYFTHIKRIYKDLPLLYPELSGICHHMVFEQDLVTSLIEEVEKRNGVPFIDIVIKNLDMRAPVLMAFSEYELYFNYVMHKKRGEMRTLKWAYIGDLGMIRKYQKYGFDFVCLPSWRPQ